MNHGLNIPTPLPPGTRPGTARPILLVLCLQKQFAESTALEILLPPPQEKELLEVEMKCCSGQECAPPWGLGRSEPCSRWHRDENVPSALEWLFLDSECFVPLQGQSLFTPGQARAENVPWLPALCSGKFPLREPGLSHFGYNPNPGLMGHLVPWDSHGLARPPFSRAPSAPAQDCPITGLSFFVNSPGPICFGSEKLKLL